MKASADASTVGISIRLIQQWTPEPPQRMSVAEHAWLIAVHDDRACPFAEKFRDAQAYLLTHPRIAGFRQRVAN